MTSTYDKAVSLIRKPPETRRDFELQPLLPWFQKRSQLFRTIKLECLKDIVRNCRFVQKQKDEIVIRQGDIGDCFYIILRGEISIYNKDETEKDEVAKLGAGAARDDTIAAHQASHVSHNAFPDRSKLGNFVTNLGTGSNFGDIALVTGDCLRTASIVANETTDFIEVALDLYNRYVRDVLAKDFEERTSFIHSNPLFSGWAPKYRKQLAMALYKEEFPYEATLVKQGAPVTNIYFIIRGQVEVKLDVDMHETQYPKLFQHQPARDRSAKKGDKNELPHVAATRRRGSHSRSIKVCYLGINGSVGDTEVLMELETYLQTAVCVEKTEVLVLEMKHYDRLFVKRHPKTIDAMKMMLEVRLNNRLSITHKKELPLLQNIVQKLQETNNPSTKEGSKKGLTYADAEREFRNHRGPLIDLYGPGSVFHAIRIREKTRSKIKMHALLKQKTQVLGSHVVEDMYGESPTAHQSQVVGDPSEYYVTSPVFDLNNFGNNYESSYPLASDAFRLPENGKNVLYTSAEDEVALSNLEDRIRIWLTKSGAKTDGNVRSLRRLAVQNIDDFPKQGHRVIVRRRRCRRTTPDVTPYDACSVNEGRLVVSH